MDLLCSESLVTDSEQLYKSNNNPLTAAQKTTRQYKLNYNCIRNASTRRSSHAAATTKSVAAPATSANNNTNNNNSNNNNNNNNSVCSVSVPIACNMSKLVYVLTSVATSAGVTNTSTKQQQQQQQQQLQQQSNSYQSWDQQRSPEFSHNHNVSFSGRTAATAAAAAATVATNPAGGRHVGYVNSHVVVTDPTFKTDRCLENALKSEEKHQQIVETYFKTVQKDITPPMRKIVAEWMMEVCAEEKCQEEVVLLALKYMDRFLSTKSVRKTHLQILAAACLLLASKLREPSCRALSAELLVFYTDNSINKDDLIKWELYVLSRLGWDLSSVTPLDFLELLILRLPIRSNNFSELNIEKIRQHAQAFISLAAKEHKFAKYTASTIAASSIAASISGLNWHMCTGHNIHFLLNLLTDLTSVGQEQLQQCMIQMEAIFEEHSHKLQPLFVSGEKPQALNGYYNGRYQHQQCQQRHHMPKMSVLSNLSQTCKLQAQTQKELQEIKF